MKPMRSAKSYLYPCLPVLGLILSLLGCSSACRKGLRIVRHSEANILLITLDTTRADRLGCYGCAVAHTPNLDRLAAEGVRFSRADSPVPLTLPAHASIMTGTYPLFHQVRNNGDYFLPPPALTLAEIFKSRGYATAAFIASFTLDSRFGLDQGFDLYDDRFGDPAVLKGVYSERSAKDVFLAFSAWFSQHNDSKFFAWVHFYDPHMPYDPPEVFKAKPGLDPYDGEIANVDLYVGNIMEMLDQRPSIRENTLVIIAGDHGEAFGEHGEFGHGVFCYQESLAVPLIISSPGRLPVRHVVSERVSLVDVFPTVLDYCGVEVPLSVHGLSLLPHIEKDRPAGRSSYFESYFPLEHLGSAPVKGVIQDNQKYIELPRPELYDLEQDPDERNNLVSVRAGAAEKMQLTLRTLEKQFGGTALDSARSVSPEELSRLESLGYVSLRKPGESRDVLPDPKDRISGWSAFMRGMALHQTGQPAEAKAALREAILLVPDLTGPFIQLGEILFIERDFKSLVSLFEEGIRLHPKSGELRIRFAHYLILLGNTSAALDQLRAAEQVVSFGQREQLYDTLGMAFGTAGDFTRAADAYSLVLEIEPDNADAVRKRGYALFRMGRLEDALADFHRAEALNPDNPLLLEEMGRFFAAKRDYERAEAYFKKALGRANPPPLAFFNYAILLSEQGDFSRAIEFMERYVSMPGQEGRTAERARRLIASWRRR